MNGTSQRCACCGAPMRDEDLATWIVAPAAGDGVLVLCSRDCEHELEHTGKRIGIDDAQRMAAGGAA